MKSPSSLLAIALMLTLCTPLAGEAAAGKDIALAQVPEHVRLAAEKAVPGIHFTEAEVKTGANGDIYELEGKAGGKGYEIKVSAEGKVLKVEKENHVHD